ncbi:TetR/AcrR family transcriptional regulator [Citricoccus sp. GCM10030269]|uniref:TetR/AcrR family transcriptional regulator n=1 Tax=Citricoccus sp. GCM10030269 TaxID=3273388 RepID=UPI00361AD9BF
MIKTPADSPPESPTTARQLARDEMERRILASARRQLADVGPARLSLRAVTRDIGVASSAVYRYVASRDELITRLILQVFGELGDEVEQAAEAAAPDAATQWRTWATTLRRWALDHPFDWALVYGTPIPGYTAPQATIDPATRVNAPVLGLPGFAAEDLGPDEAETAASLQPLAEIIRASDHEPASPGTTFAMMTAWSAVHGFINLELGGHFVGAMEKTDPVFDTLLRRLVRDFGLERT